MKFSTRLYAAFGGGALLSLALGLFALYEIGALTSHTREIAHVWMPSTNALLSIKAEMREFRTLELQHILSTGKAEHDDYEVKMDAADARIWQALDRYETLVTSAAERTLYDRLRREHRARIDAHAALRKLSRAGQTAEAIALARGEIGKLRTASTGTVDELVKLNADGADAEAKAAAESEQTARRLIPAGIVLATAFGALLGWLIVRDTMRRLGGDPAAAQAAVDRIADGDLQTPIALHDGDTGSLLAALARMRGRLADIVGEITRGSDGIRQAAGEVARGNLDLSARTEQQSSSLEETASAMEELASTVKNTAANARAADELARAASETARHGGATVASVVETMQGIAASSKKMRDIIGAIDGIAFQTNILALNAAVEAARAGDQGRGFAVVASEVRTLAQRSAGAAREIRQLIEDSITRVDDGVRRVGDAGTAIEEVVGSAHRVTEVVNEIMLATEQQSTGIEQINQAVSQLDGVTQQNAALVEQAAAATGSMDEQAERLVASVAVFRV